MSRTPLSPLRPNPAARRARAKAALFGRPGRILVGFLPYAWLILFFLVPFLIVFKISLSEYQKSMPPYAPLFEMAEGHFVEIRAHLSNYQLLIEGNLYLYAYLNSLMIAAISTILCLLIGYPMAYAIARSSERWRTSLLLLIILPFWTSFLIRVYAWMGILADEGLLNKLLLKIGLITQPLVILNTDVAVYIGIVYSYLPFMILPLYATLEKMDMSLLEAAADLGCRPTHAFFRITLPLSMPGIIAGSMLVFIPAVGEFVIPDLLGGSEVLMIGKALWNEFFTNRDWPAASAVAIAMLLFLVIPVMFFQRYQSRSEEEGR